MEEQRRIQRIAITMVAIAIVGLLVGIAAVALRPRTYTNFGDAVGAKLQERGIAYEAIYLDQSWHDAQNRERYTANLIVHSSSSTDVFGLLQCREEQRGCSFSIPRFGIRSEPLPELVSSRPPTWLRWIEERVPWLR